MLQADVLDVDVEQEARAGKVHVEKFLFFPHLSHCFSVHSFFVESRHLPCHSLSLLADPIGELGAASHEVLANNEKHHRERRHIWYAAVKYA